jgi:large subunit ribosomal protein L10
MSKKLKQWMAGEVRREVAGAGACVVLGYRSLSGETSSSLRAHLRKSKVTLTVLRNRVTGHALAGTPLQEIRPFIKGQTAVATGGEDAAALARAVVEGMKGRKDLECRGGFVEGRVVTGDEIRHLASLPTRPELLAMIASAVVAPIVNVAYGIDAILTGVARAVEAVRAKKEEEQVQDPAPPSAPPAP